MPILCVDIIVVWRKKFLLLKRKNKPAQGLWWFPGGRVNKLETLEDAVKRKSKEEMGIDVKIDKSLGTETTIYPDGPFDDRTHTVNVVFLVRPLLKNHSVKLDDQSEDYQWFEKVDRKWHPYIKNVLKKAGYGKK